MRIEKIYSSFKELKKHLTSAKADTLTFFVDQLLLTNHTKEALLEKIKEVKETKFKTSNDFKTLAIVKKHIRYRQAHNNIVFSVNKKNEIRMIAVDYDSEVQETLKY